MLKDIRRSLGQKPVVGRRCGLFMSCIAMQVAVALDPPIRKGQTYYHHVLVQFSKDEDLSVSLDISDELFAAKNEKVPLAAQPSTRRRLRDAILQCVRLTAVSLQTESDSILCSMCWLRARMMRAGALQPCARSLCCKWGVTLFYLSCQGKSVNHTFQQMQRGSKLQREVGGPAHQVLARAPRGLS